MRRDAYIIAILVCILLPLGFSASQIAFKKTRQNEMADQINAVFSTVQSKVDRKSLEDFFKNTSVQIVDGVKKGFEASQAKTNKELLEFSSEKQKVTVSDIVKPSSSWKNKEKFAGHLTNGTSKPIKQIRVSVSYYGVNNELLDVKEEWLSSIKVLNQNESVGFSFERELGKFDESDAALQARAANLAKVKVISFEWLQNE